ncbi:MAG: FtsX-like permease family protein, partial [Chloroflexi bacterium]|nr:FtsX-like permease family protein [Chloroflexota bacterium]
VTGRATDQLVGGPNGIDETFFAQLRVEQGIRTSAPVVEGFATTVTTPTRTLTVLGIDPFSEAPFRPELTPGGGALGSSLVNLLTAPNAVLMSQTTADALGVALGAEFSVNIAGQPQLMTLVGILAPGDPSTQRALTDLLITDISVAQTWFGKVGRIDRIDLILDEAQRATVQASLPSGIRLITPEQRAQSTTEMTASFEINLNALSLLALVVGMFLIYNTMTFAVVQRRQLLGTLRCLGVSQGEIARLMLVEGAVIGILGTALGIAIGIGLAQLLLSLVSRTINDIYYVVSVSSIQLSIWPIFKGVVLGLLASLVALAIPTWEAARTPPRTVLRRSSYEEQTQRMVPILGVVGAALVLIGGVIMWLGPNIFFSYAGLLALTLGAAMVTPICTVWLMQIIRPVAVRVFGLVAGMAVRDVVTSLSRTAVAVAALMIAVAVTIAVGLMVASFRLTVVDWLSTTIRADVFVSAPSITANRLDTPLPAGVAERVATLEGVERVRRYRSVLIPTDQTPVLQIALDVTPADYETFIWAEGDPATIWPAFARDHIIISEPLALKRDLHVGDTFVMQTDRGDVPMTIAGVFYDYGTELGVVMMPIERYWQLYDDQNVSSLGVYLDAGVESEAMVERVRTEFPNQALNVRSNRTLRETSIEILDRTFAITNVLQLLATIVAFVGILAALTAMQLERLREFGMLRAIGLDPRQLWQLVLSETGLMGVVAGLVAMPVGTAMAMALIFVINRISFGWTLQFAFEPAIYAQALVTAVIAALLAGIVPAWRISRVAPALALREE